MQLFQYDSDALQASAIASACKNGPLSPAQSEGRHFRSKATRMHVLVRNTTFDLSQRRVTSVKLYLVEVMRINPAQIETRGYGAATIPCVRKRIN